MITFVIHGCQHLKLEFFRLCYFRQHTVTVRRQFNCYRKKEFPRQLNLSRGNLVLFPQQVVGILSRSRNIYSTSILAIPGGKLSLLVENQGRINFGNFLKDIKVSKRFLHLGMGIAWVLRGYVS